MTTPLSTLQLPAYFIDSTRDLAHNLQLAQILMLACRSNTSHSLSM
ncbi:hypothetical protein SNOG_07797 [Parastagonospora nodorum SN15]|uniref:Uncharacterized protein n=1 Tax=Phaeosphaeria nodorum (strain SN15 / ATCC MYA-4574 / FGSC 10173) TaxID=321614 RepID=Q0UKB7_PHANO|nr:hypothetical protein SNOG_07797 [Parastagonospora nodorum SN15]EAT85263.1 hypothetical protein SNOG_07797 [Parastagonospora nodorum SN15]